MPHVEKINWRAVEPELQFASRELVKSLGAVADSISRSGRNKNTPLVYKANYQYGQQIVREGVFTPPCGDTTTVLHRCDECQELMSAVGYSSIPLGLVMTNCLEVFLQAPVSAKGYPPTAPLALLQAGELFGVFEVYPLHRISKSKIPQPSWNISSGARSIVIVDPLGGSIRQTAISEALQLEHVQLGNWNDIADDHWQLIRPIANVVNKVWSAAVLIFPQEWFAVNTEISRDLFYELGWIAWEQSAHLRDQGTAELLSAYSSAVHLEDKDGKKIPEDYYLDKTVRHLVGISRGTDVALHPDLSTTIGPLQAVQDFFLRNKVWKPTDNFPFILRPCHVGRHGCDYGYYSLKHPLIHYSAHKSKYAKQMDDVVKRLKRGNAEHSGEWLNAFGENTSQSEQKFADYLSTFARRDLEKQMIRAALSGWNLNSHLFNVRGVFSGLFRIQAGRTRAHSDFPSLPVLESIQEAVASTYDLADVGFVCVQHLLESTGSLVQALVGLGARPANIFMVGKGYSTNIDVVAQLQTLGIQIKDTNALTARVGFQEALRNNVEWAWKLMSKTATDNALKMIIVLDDGGHCLSLLPEQLASKTIVIEQTTSGLQRNDGPLKCPVILVASCAAKKLMEPPLIGRAIIAKASAVLSTDFRLEACGIIGLGSIGRALATDLVNIGAKVFGFDINASVQDTLPAGVEWCPHGLAELVNNVRYVFGCTGQDLFRDQVFTNIQRRVLISCSSEDKEFATLLKPSDFLVDRQRQPFSPVQIEQGSVILRGGFPINFDGTPQSVPNEDIQMTRGLLLGATMQAVISKSSHLTKGRRMLNPTIQKFVVDTWFTDVPRRAACYDKETRNGFSSVDWIKGNSGGEFIKDEKITKLFAKTRAAKRT